MMFQRKKKEDDGLDIIDNVKEPFSLANFVEDHVITKWKKFRKMLEERGILFFLMSPFQYRNRLIAKISLVIVGILIGVVPRTFTLIEQTKERNASSEMASILEKAYTTGNITTHPLSSGQYEKQHVLAFLIEGDTNKGVPSTTNKYVVTLSQKRGVTDMEHVSAQYEILPINATSRLLIVYVDNRQQNDETGNYNVSVRIKDDDIENMSLSEMEVVLSNNQQTTSLFDQDGVHLSVLSNQILNGTQTTIKDAQTKLADAIKVYTLNEERLAAMNMQIEMSSTQLQAYVDEHTALSTLLDTSNSEDIKSMTYDKDFAINHPMDLKAALTYDGTRYAAIDNRSEQANLDIYKEVDDLTAITGSVISALSNLNGVRNTKYTQLITLQNTLNQPLPISNLKGEVVVMP